MSKYFPDYEDMDTLVKKIDEKLSEKQPLEFIGAAADWEALSTAEKQQYSVANFTDDDSQVGNVLEDVTDKITLSSFITAISSNRRNFRAYKQGDMLHIYLFVVSEANEMTSAETHIFMSDFFKVRIGRVGGVGAKSSSGEVFTCYQNGIDNTNLDIMVWQRWAANTEYRLDLHLAVDEV